jgi:glycosyltransferase involved in cell wall biosynthesis
MKKKVLIFSLNYYPKYVGGAEVAIKEIVERLDKNKYEFHMLTLRFDSDLPKNEIIHGIHVHRIGFTKKGASLSEMRKFPLYFNKYFFQIFGGLYGFYLHKKNKYDAAWSMMPTATGVPMGILKLLTFGKLKTIVTFQEGDPIPHMIKFVLPGWPLFVYSIRSANIIQAISTFLLNWSRDLGYKGCGVVIPNGVDVQKFTRIFSELELENVKKTLGKNANEIWLITTSRLVHKNGVDDCIKALKKLKDKNKKYFFAILGIGSEEEKYKDLAKDLEVEDQVKFVGEVKHPELATYLKVCDIFIRPSRSEGMGNSFVEAMSMKMPVIATREGGLSDFIFDCETAFVCSKDNPESIVGAIDKISEFQKTAQVEKVLDHAYEMVLEKYNWEHIAKEMESQVFSKVI